MSDIIEKIKNLDKKFKNNRQSFEPFISHIRFPKYKGLASNSIINFQFPITLLVGQNGGNKTSILQALYGAPEGKSIGDYWFSTDIDEIQSGKGINRQCFIYGYYFKEADKIVEVLKTRIKKEGNPDYWEPARPSKSYDMEILDDYTKYGSNNKTRWDVMKKNVVYCDCKEYVSAFDLFFYHFNFKKTKTQLSKQDFIRRRSKKLAEVLKNNTTSYDYYKKEMVITNEIISDEVCKIVSEIMGEEYTKAKIISHNFYTKGEEIKPSKTIWIEKNGKTYSEAFAGTGEARIFLLINDLLKAKTNSLILIDEPEISLHPSAIYKLKRFILDQALKNNHQIIITTHSTHLIKDFPKEAIKVVTKDGESIEIIENIEYPDAFYELGEEYSNKKMLYVEDKLVVYLLEYIIKKSSSENLKKNLAIKYLPGGAQLIKSRYILNAALQDQENCYYLLDGDQRIDYQELIDSESLQKYYLSPTSKKIDISKIPPSDYKYLPKLIRAITGVKMDIKVSGNTAHNDQELIDKQLQLISFWEKFVDYLPGETPEKILAELIINKENKSYDFSLDPNAKEFFIQRTQQALGYLEVDGNDIFEEQKRAIAYLSEEHYLFKELNKKLFTIVKD